MDVGTRGEGGWMSVEWQKLLTLEVKRAYSISNGGDVWNVVACFVCCWIVDCSFKLFITLNVIACYKYL